MGNKGYSNCWCGQPGQQEHMSVFGGHRVWAYAKFCSDEHKQTYEERGDHAAALTKTASKGGSLSGRLILKPLTAVRQEPVRTPRREDSYVSAFSSSW